MDANRPCIFYELAIHSYSVGLYGGLVRGFDSGCRKNPEVLGGCWALRHWPLMCLVLAGVLRGGPARLRQGFALYCECAYSIVGIQSPWRS